MRDLVASIVPFVATLIVLLVGAAARHFAGILRAKGASESIARAFDVVGRAASIVVRDAEQTIVRDLKDPTKPGSWSSVAAKSVKESAAKAVRDLVPAQIDELKRRGLSDDAIESLVNKAVESAVWEMHRETNTPK